MADVSQICGHSTRRYEIVSGRWVTECCESGVSPRECKKIVHERARQELLIRVTRPSPSVMRWRKELARCRREQVAQINAKNTRSGRRTTILLTLEEERELHTSRRVMKKRGTRERKRKRERKQESEPYIVPVRA